jgi:hypothetical protein
VAAQSRPCRLPGESTAQTVGALVKAGNHEWPGEVFGGEVESVEITGRRGAEPDSRVLMLALHRWWRTAVKRHVPGSARSAQLRSEDEHCRAGAPYAGPRPLPLRCRRGWRVRPRVIMVYSCCRDSSPITMPCMVSAVTP